MARDLAQPYDAFEAALHELRGALVDLDGDGRPDATMPIPPAAKAIQFIDDKLAPYFPDESRSGNAMQVAQGGPVMTDDGYLSPEEQWANVPQTQAAQPPERPPQRNAMTRYLSNSWDALGRVPGDLWKLVPEAQPNEGGEPSQDMWGSIANSPAGQFAGNVVHALGSGLPAVGSGAPRIGAMAGPALRSLSNGVQRGIRSMTPAGRETNAMTDALDSLSVRNHRLSSGLEDAGRPLPPRPFGPEPADLAGQIAREKQYGNTLRTHDSLRRRSVDTARADLEASRSTPYARMRDPATGRFVKKSDEIATREQQLRVAESGGGSWDMETADQTFDAASRSLRGFRDAVAGRNFEQASELISRQTGVPVDQVMPSLVRWSRGR